jgi:hypothetical protein
MERVPFSQSVMFTGSFLVAGANRLDSFAAIGALFGVGLA